MRHPFIRTLAGQKDPYFKNTTLLLHGDGTNGGQNNTFVDGSTNNFAITRNGNTTQGTFSPYGDKWSNYFDGTGDDLSLTGQNLSATDWTVECWVYFQSFSNNAPHVWNFGTDISNRYNVWRNNTTGTFSFTRVNGGSYDIKNGTTSPVVGRWYHIAVVRVNSTGVQTLYVDGVAEVTNTGPISTGTTWTIGFVPGGGTGDRMLGYISNFRVVTSAVYTANFTPPTAPPTAITNTSLLTCSTNRFRDVSSNNRTITRNGDVSVQRFSPFSPTAAYAAGTIGGSGYFDGTGDFLTAASNSAFEIGTGQFTLELWLYFNTVTNINEFVRAALEDVNGRLMMYYASGGLSVGPYGGGAGGTSVSWTPTSGQWYHIAASRDGSNNQRLFVNGVLLATTTSTVNYSQSGFGLFQRLGNFSGYCTDLRLLKGAAAYTANFTPPTAPLTAITNTSLLLNFTNAAIRDNAMMAVPETVGNAQIDTTTKKFGTGSLEFDGTGDYLTLPLSENYRLGTGDFTIEMWVYFNVLTGYQCLIDLRNGTVNAIGPVLYTNIASPTILRFYTAGADRISTSALSTGLWYHIALTRSGTSTKLFVNGSQEGSTYTDSNNYIINSPRISVFSNDSNAGFINGYVDDIRITKGVARYTSNFTPPTAPFPDF